MASLEQEGKQAVYPVAAKSSQQSAAHSIIVLDDSPTTVAVHSAAICTTYKYN